MVTIFTLKFLGKTAEKKVRRKGRKEKKRQQREGRAGKRRKRMSSAGRGACQAGSGCGCRNRRDLSLLHCAGVLPRSISQCSLSPCLTPALPPRSGPGWLLQERGAALAEHAQVRKKKQPIPSSRLEGFLFLKLFLIFFLFSFGCLQKAEGKALPTCATTGPPFGRQRQEGVRT